MQRNVFEVSCVQTDSRPTDDHMDAAPPDDRERSLALFPNALPVTGIKHITDNIVGTILENLPQLLD